MGLKTIKESMVEIKKEKLAIVLKELLHLKYILNYYSTKAPKDYPKRTNKVDMSTANSSLSNVEKSLCVLKKHIDMLDKSSSNSKDDIYFLILHSKIGYDLNNLLYIIELIYKKVYQIFEESYHQYIPKPTLGRRFSNNNLVGNLKNHYQSIIKTLVGKENIGLILSWSYRNYISLEEKHDRFADNNNNQYGAYINLPYWYYEIPTLLPSVAHECVRVALLQNSPELKKYEKVFQDAVNRHLNAPRDDLSFVQEEIILSDKNKLTNKVVADLISYEIYGCAYLYSLFNDIIGAGLSKLFSLENSSVIEEYSSLKEYIENNFNWKVSSYKFNNLRDISIIRLKILLDYASNFRCKSENDKNIQTRRIEQMQELLATMIPSKEEKSGLELIYENHPHYRDSFLTLKRAILNISKLYKKESKKVSLLNLKGIKNINFTQLWDKHFKENIHKNELRRLLHKETIESIKNRILDKNEEIEEIGTPYSLVFIKMLKKIDCNSFKNNKGKKCLESAIDRYFEDRDKYKSSNSYKKYYHAFGIYDLAILKDTSSYPNKINDTIKSKFRKISLLNKEEKKSKSKYSLMYNPKKIDKQIIKNVNNFSVLRSEDKGRYYESRFSLMQIYPTIEGSNKEKNSNVSIMYNIDLVTENNSAGEELAESICKIANKIKDNKEYFKKVKIFKTLGPGDLIIFVDGISNSNFLMLTEKVLVLPCIKRTFTTVLAEKDKKELITPQDNYRIVSFVRLDISKTLKLETIIEDVLYEDKNILDNIESINFTSGVLDVEIKWEAETSVETVMDFYNRLMEKSYVRDFQTKFNKNYPLKKDKNNRCMYIPLDRNGPAR